MALRAGSTAVTKINKTPTLVELTLMGIIMETKWDKNLLKQCPFWAVPTRNFLLCPFIKIVMLVRHV